MVTSLVGPDIPSVNGRQAPALPVRTRMWFLWCSAWLEASKPASRKGKHTDTVVHIGAPSPFCQLQRLYLLCGNWCWIPQNVLLLHRIPISWEALWVCTKLPDSLPLGGCSAHTAPARSPVVFPRTFLLLSVSSTWGNFTVMKLHGDQWCSPGKQRAAEMV